MTELPSPDEIRVEMARRRFQDFREYVDPKLIDGWWQRDAAGHLQQFYNDLRAGRRPKLAIFAPPQHGKTRLVQDFVMWVLGRWPDCRIIYASYSHDLGVDTNRTLQRVMDDDAYLRVFPASRLGGEAVVTQFNKPRRNQQHLELADPTLRGSFRNTTTGGQITGKTLDLGVGDDLLKGDREALSKTVRESAWGWYLRDFLSRFDDQAGQLQIGTRWTLDDPLGRMVREMSDIKVLSYPALALADDAHRREGEPLFPEFKSREFLKERQQLYSSSQFSALYQQDPVPEGGAIVKEAWLANRYRARGEAPKRVVQSWDCASKAAERNDPSACVTFAEFKDRVEVWHVEAGRREFPELVRRAQDMYASDSVRGPKAPNAVLVEDKDAGQQLIQVLRRETKLPVVAVNPGRLDKLTRMDGETPFIEAGKLWLPESAPWLIDYVAELTTTPACAHDDMFDATSQALAWFRTKRTRFYGVIGVERESPNIV